MTIKETVLFTKKKKKVTGGERAQSLNSSHRVRTAWTPGRVPGPGRTAAPPPEPRKGNALNPRGRLNPCN